MNRPRQALRSPILRMVIQARLQVVDEDKLALLWFVIEQLLEQKVLVEPTGVVTQQTHPLLRRFGWN